MNTKWYWQVRVAAVYNFHGVSCYGNSWLSCKFRRLSILWKCHTVATVLTGVFLCFLAHMVTKDSEFLCCVGSCMNCAVSWLKWSVIASGQGKSSPEPESMVLCGTDTCRALPPAPEVINMHLATSPAFPLPHSLGHPSWHCSVVLAPVLHQPSCKGYNSCLCLCRANTDCRAVLALYRLLLSRG